MVVGCANKWSSYDRAGTMSRTWTHLHINTSPGRVETFWRNGGSTQQNVGRRVNFCWKVCATNLFLQKSAKLFLPAAFAYWKAVGRQFFQKRIRKMSHILQCGKVGSSPTGGDSEGSRDFLANCNPSLRQVKLEEICFEWNVELGEDDGTISRMIVLIAVSSSRCGLRAELNSNRVSACCSEEKWKKSRSTLWLMTSMMSDSDDAARSKPLAVIISRFPSATGVIDATIIESRATRCSPLATSFDWVDKSRTSFIDLVFAQRSRDLIVQSAAGTWSVFTWRHRCHLFFS